MSSNNDTSRYVHSPSDIENTQSTTQDQNTEHSNDNHSVFEFEDKSEDHQTPNKDVDDSSTVRDDDVEAPNNNNNRKERKSQKNLKISSTDIKSPLLENVEAIDSTSSVVDDSDEENRIIKRSEDGEEEMVKETEEDPEQYKLGGRSPLSTILNLMVGPLLSQIVQSLYGLMGSFWVSRTIGQKGLTVMSIVQVIDFIPIAFAQFFNVAMSTRLSFLFGKQTDKEVCAQVVVDLLRVCIIVGFLTAGVLLPLVKPLMRWYGGDEEIVEMCFEYLSVALSCSFINYSYLALCGLLQAMGNSVYYGIAQITSSILNMFVFDPLFLVGLKSGMWGCSFATVLSNLCPLMTIYVCLFWGKFTVKPKLSSYCKKFNPHCFDAIKVSVSQLIANLAAALPFLLLSKLAAKASTRNGTYTETMAAINVNDRLYSFALCVCNGLNQGFLPAASYAFGKNNIQRLTKMYWITISIGTCWTTFVCILFESIPHFFARIWGKDPLYIEITSKIIRIGFGTCMANQVVLTTTACLQAMRMVTLSIVNSLITMLIPVPVFSVIIYFIDQKDPIKLFFSFICHDVFDLALTSIIIIWKLKFLCRKGVVKDGEIPSNDFNGQSTNNKENSDTQLDNIDDIEEKLISDDESKVKDIKKGNNSNSIVEDKKISIQAEL